LCKDAGLRTGDLTTLPMLKQVRQERRCRSRVGEGSVSLDCPIDASPQRLHPAISCQKDVPESNGQRIERPELPQHRSPLLHEGRVGRTPTAGLNVIQCRHRRTRISGRRETTKHASHCLTMAGRYERQALRQTVLDRRDRVRGRVHRTQPVTYLRWCAACDHADLPDTTNLEACKDLLPGHAAFDWLYPRTQRLALTIGKEAQRPVNGLNVYTTGIMNLRSY
jgi:hypothetical protein